MLLGGPATECYTLMPPIPPIVFLVYALLSSYKEVLRRHLPKNWTQEELLPFKEVLRRHSPKNGAQEGLLANAC